MRKTYISPIMEIVHIKDKICISAYSQEYEIWLSREQHMEVDDMEDDPVEDVWGDITYQKDTQYLRDTPWK